MTKINFSSIPTDGTHKFSFGKHKGTAIEDTPSDYLVWITNNHDDNQLIDACQSELNYRNDHGGHFYADEGDN